ncbi:MAG: peptide chain release factor 2 [Planctomycetes bacterium]|nr:peptide chain release factor 2 [Planctomycetota bacterium]HNZ66200.1 peptide chain release factor 2 [Planctomycetota bacterium]HPY75119.1 peptide chain release factor 2 [Planctomycetota bacterium]HQB00687.1 peptide chain release factor 2 [Planctomycetota bacterium]
MDLSKDEIKEIINKQKKQISNLGDSLDLEGNQKRLQIEEEKMSQAGFWNLPEEQRNIVIQNLKQARQIVEPIVELKQNIEDTCILFEMACEENSIEELQEIANEIEQNQIALQSLTLQATFQEEDDKKNAFFSIQAGSGGVEACDWAEMLLRMYLKYFDKKKYTVTTLDYSAESEAGIKSVTLQVQGNLAYGYLKSERGVHRLVRISPFDAGARRHTSFAGVDVIPEMDDNVDIEINEKDLRIDFYRSSGAGGQHVNVTDSAVRITHIPTGIVVNCQNERSQHKNRATAMKVLQARLYQKRKQEQEESLYKQYGAKTQVSWSNQIRSYVLQPYTLVKDHRTNYETGNTQAVLDGELDAFIENFLLWNNSQKNIETTNQ